MALLESPLFPNLLYLVLVAGVWLAALAIVSPGTGVPEVLAFIALTLAGFGTLIVPFNGWALALLVVGALFFLLSLRREKYEPWLGLSALALSAGSVFLFRFEGRAGAVHPLLALIVSMLTLGYFWLALRSVIRSQRAAPAIDLQRVLGQIGEVRTPLDPVGSVYVGGELWTARAERPVEAGKKVRVQAMDGLILVVEPERAAQDKS